MSDGFSGSVLKCQNVTLRSSRGILVVVCGYGRGGGDAGTGTETRFYFKKNQNVGNHPEVC